MTRPFTRLFPFLLAFFFSMYAAAAFPFIWGSSEARELQVVQSILRQGEWILPLRNGIVPSKPPLLHWLGAGLGLTFGDISAFLLRLVSITAAGVVLLAIGRIGAVVGEPGRGRLTSWLGVGVALLAPTFLRLTPDARVDMLLLATVSVAIMFLIIGAVRASEEGSTHLPTSTGIAVALSVSAGILTKGPIALIVVGAVGGTVLWALWGLPATLRVFVRWWWVALVIAVITVPWYVAASERGGDQFLGRVLFENVSRFAGGGETNREAWWFYLPSFLGNLAPWSILFLFCLRRDWHEYRSCRGGGRASLRIRFGCEVAVLVLLLFLSLSAGKRHAYLSLVVPLVAVSVGSGMTKYFDEWSESEKLRWQSLLERTGSGIGILSLVVLMGFELLRWSIAWNGVAQLAVDWVRSHAVVFELALGLLCLGWALFRRRSTLALPAVVLSIASLACMGLALGFGLKGEFKGFSQMAAEVNAVVPIGKSLVVVKEVHEEYFDPLFAALNREVALATPPLQQLPAGFTLLREPEFKRCVNTGCVAEDAVQVLAELEQPIHRLRGEDEDRLLLVFVKREDS